MKQISEIAVVRIEGKWYVEGPWKEPCGPYPTKADAQDVCRGLIRTYKYHKQSGFITTCGSKRTRVRLS